MTATDRVFETYHAALRHELVSLPKSTHLAGVVRRPTGWFRSEIDQNYVALGPPDTLLDETKDVQSVLGADLDDVAAHNTAWERVDFERRYREHIASNDAAQETLTGLAGRVTAGEPVALVCYEGEDKRCHRRILRDLLQQRVMSP